MYLKKRTASFLAGLVCCLAANAQGPAPYVPNIIPPSPAASVLMKFADVPVSPYTGASDISVPIYTVQVNGVSVPVGISYHTGGIRLGEESGLTGLGWGLNVGGTISRTVRDKDDFTNGYFGSNVPQIEGDLAFNQPANSHDPSFPFFDVNRYMFCFACNYNVNFASGATGDYTNLFLSATADAEADSYSYNIGGRSGKFIIKKDYTIVMEKQDNIKIQFIKTGGYYTFLVTDESGNKYYFNYLEFNYQHTGTPVLSSWHLTKVVTQQNDVITFTYATPGSITIGQDVQQTYRYGCPVSGWTYSSYGSQSYDNVNLQTIDFPNGQVKFVYSGGRTDLQGATKLDAVKIYSKTTAGLNYLKEDDLYYSYFSSGTSNPLELTRLRLDSVKEVSGTVKVNPYVFAYNAAPATYGEKHSFSVDHWGYYNGAGNTSFIPTTNTNFKDGTLFYNNPNSVLFQFSGANRETDSVAMKCFSLSQVTYPTGGKTVLDYSANSYDYQKSIVGPTDYPNVQLVQIDTNINISAYGQTNGTFDFSKLAYLIGSNTVGTNANVNVAFINSNSPDPNTGSSWPDAARNTFRKLYVKIDGPNYSNIYADISDGGMSCGGLACSLNLPLSVIQQSASAYTWQAYVDPGMAAYGFSLIHLRITFQATKTAVNGNNTLLAGGLRIKSITDYSSGSTIAKKKGLGLWVRFV